MDIAILRTIYTGETRDLEAANKRAESSLKSFEKTSEQTSNSFGNAQSKIKSAALSASSALKSFGSVMSVGVTAPLLGFATTAVRSSASLDSLKRGLIAVSGSAENAEQQFARLKEVAKLPGLGFKEAVEGSINLQAAGFNANLAERALKGFGNALATVGKGKAELDGVVLALGQIQSKGKISAEEINQIAERVPQIRKIMQGAFGTSDTETLQKMGISSEKFVEKITTELEKLPQVAGGISNAFENLADTVDQALTPVGDAINRFLVPAIDAIAPKIADLSTYFQNLSPAAQNIAIGFAGAAAAIGPAAYAFGLVTEAVIAVGSAINPVSLAIAAGVAVIAGAAYTAYQAWETNFANIRGIVANFRDMAVSAFDSLSTTIQPALDAVSQYAAESFGSIKEWWNKEGQGISDSANRVLTDMKNGVKLILDGVTAFWSAHGEEIKVIVSAAWDAVKAIISGAGSIIGNAIKVIAGLIRGDWQAVWDGTKGIVERAIDAVAAVLSGCGNLLIGAFKTSFNVFMSVSDWVYERGKEIGENIGKGLVNGITSYIDPVGAAARALGNAAASAANKQLGIRSPSRVFYQIGAFVAEGLANGITESTGSAVAAVGKMIDAVIERTSTSKRAQRNDKLDDVLRDYSNFFKDAAPQTTFLEKINALLADPSVAKTVSENTANLLRQAAGIRDNKKSTDDLKESLSSLDSITSGLFGEESPLAKLNRELSDPKVSLGIAERAKQLGMAAESYKATLQILQSAQLDKDATSFMSGLLERPYQYKSKNAIESGIAATIALPELDNSVAPLIPKPAKTDLDFWKSFTDDIGYMFDGVFSNIQDGWRGMLGGLLQDFTRSLSQMASQMFTSALYKGLTGQDAQQSSGGGWLSKLLGIGIGAIGSAFGGKVAGGLGGAISKANSNMNTGLLSTSGTIARSFGGFRANGGDVSPNTAYWVGENRQPELFVPKTNGTIFNQNQLGQMGGNTQMINNFNFYPDPKTGQFSRESAQQAAKKAASHLTNEQRRS